MKAILLLAIAWWIAGGVGRTLVGRLAVLREWPLERFVFASALGLGIAAYGVLGLGLCGLLSFWPITIWWVLLGLAGFGGMRANGADLIAWGRNLKPNREALNRLEGRQLVALGAATVLLLCGLVAIAACFRPPDGRQWDALAYHLADPKVFLQQGRITSLPTEHHSNFPFTLEMLFTVGLLYDGYALANLFHFLTAVLTVLGILAFARRVLNPTAGWIGATLFATTPLVLWESTVAYIDIGLGLYTMLATFAAVSSVQEGASTKNTKQHEEDHETDENPASPPSLVRNERQGKGAGGLGKPEWLLLVGGTLGLALGVKYLALLPFGIVCGFLLWRRVPVRGVALAAGIALAIGSPWYIKNLVLTQNPVYPYFYSAFPQSRYWSRDRAEIYTSEQQGFGYPHSLKQPIEAVRNLGETPWRLLANANVFTNLGNYTFTELLGGWAAAFGLAFLMVRPASPRVRSLLIIGGLQVVAWFFVAQVGRYLVAVLPLFAVVAGYTAVRLCERQEGVRGGVRLAARGLVGFLLVGQSLLLFWGLGFTPISPPTSAAEAYRLGVLPTSLSGPEVIGDIFQPDRRMARLEKTLDLYPAMAWLNANTPKEAGVAFYDEVRGFYLDRPYLWANREHSAYIPYETLPDGRALTEWLRQKGYRFALINLKNSPNSRPSEELPRGALGMEPLALQRWYMEAPVQPDNWRRLLSDALRNAGWRVVFAQYGVVVLEF